MSRIAPYAAALVDVLNQKAQLNIWSKFPENDDDRDDVKLALARSLGAVELVRRTFALFAEHYMKRIIATIEETSEGQFTKKELNSIRSRIKASIDCQMFSDTTVLFTPVRTRRTKDTVLGLEGLLSGAAFAMVFSLANGIAIRGAIDIAIGTNFFRNQIYGPVLHRTYYLEQEVAEYPRIVVGDGTIEFLERWINDKGTDLGSALNRQRAKECMRLIEIDTDGKRFVHFLGARARESILSSPKWLGQVEAANEFAFKELSRFANDPNNSELASRYQRLTTYFKKHIGDWR